MGVAAALLASEPAEAAQGTLRWNARSSFGIANCEQLGLDAPTLAFCQSLTGWVPAALPVDGYGHFILNDVPLPTKQSPAGSYAYDPVLFGIGIFKQGVNTFDANFDTSLLRIGSNRVRFDYGPNLTNGIVTWDRFSLVSSSGPRDLLAVSHQNKRAWRLLRFDPVNKNHYCLGYPPPWANLCSAYADGYETGEELDFNNLAATFNVSVDEANPGFSQSLRALNDAIVEAEVSLIDNARGLDDLGAKLDRLEQLHDDVEELISKGLDQVTPADMSALLANYADVPASVRDALVQMVTDLKRTVQELRDELKRINTEFEGQVRGVVDLINQNIAGSGFDPTNPAGYDFGGGSVPSITLPAIPSDFDPAHDPYKAYADKVLAQLGALVVSGKVTDRSAFSSVVRIWEANQKALSRALLQNSTSQAEFGAFTKARQDVTDFLRKYLDDQGWFLDNPVPIHIRSLFDGTYARILGEESVQLKDALNLWNGSELTSAQDVMVDMVQGLASGMAAIEGELAPAGELLTRLNQLNADLSRAAAHIGVGFVPFAGDALDFCEVTTGREFCVETGRELSNEERMYSAAGLGIGSGTFWRGVGSVFTITVGVIAEPLVKIFRDERRLVAEIWKTDFHGYRGIRSALSTFDQALEPVAAKYLSAAGRTHFLVGDKAVQKALKMVDGDSPVDFINVLADGRLALSEVKDLESAAGLIDVGNAIKKFESTLPILKSRTNPAADVGVLEILVGHGQKNRLKGDWAVSGDQLVVASTGAVRRVDGLVIKVIEVE